MRDAVRGAATVIRAGKIISVFAAAIMAAVICAAPVGQAFAAKGVDEALAALARGYESRRVSADVGQRASTVVSFDTRIDGTLTDLVRRYGSKNIGNVISGVPSLDTLGSWWNALGDETLTELIWQALRNNRDLQAATARVTEARATLGISKAARLPWLDNSDSWTRSESSENSTNKGASAEITKLSIDASWEIDIFGGRRESINAAAASLESEHARLHSAWVTLSSEVALNYLSLRTLQERLDIAHRNLALQEETLGMIKSRYEAGLSDSLALNQAYYTTSQTRAGIPPILASIESTMNTLATLTGSVPGSLEESLSKRASLPTPSSVNLVGIPAEALRQRPDIRAAERALAAQASRKKSAEKDLLPKFTLIGSIGLESLSTGNLFSGGSFGFSFGPRISLPIFHGEAIRRNIQVQEAREEQLLAAYEQAVLGAVAEVRNALAANALELERNKSLKTGMAAAQNALDVARDKYSSGLTDFSNVIGAQQALLSLEDQYTISRGQMTSNIVRVFKALGGGWTPLTEELTHKR
ncbi:MAG: efflux transporter outer membrane subunit [Synergistaceae bacterium]|jgi:NodT family efflux transporter outer membrane factor (OMF) lipoprotein|nr:efflux transporter outer membrane subunit [Synergistaceae bacterium]